MWLELVEEMKHGGNHHKAVNSDSSLPSFQEWGELGFMPNPNLSVSSQVKKEKNKEEEVKKSKKVSTKRKKEKEIEDKGADGYDAKIGYYSLLPNGTKIPVGNLEQHREVLEQAYDPSVFKKVTNTLANPVATFGYSARNEDVPWGQIESDENLFDMAIGMYNPFKMLEYGELALDDFKAGNYLGGTLNTLGALAPVPFIRQAAKSVSGGTKLVKPIVAPSSKIKFTDNVKSKGYRDLENARLTDEAVVLPDGLDPNFTKMYNQRYQSAFDKNPNLLTAYQRQFNPGNKVSLYRYTDDIDQQLAFSGKINPNLMKGSYWGSGPTNPITYADNRMYAGKAGNVFKVDVPVEDLAKHHWTKYDKFLSSKPHHSGTTNFSEFVLTPDQIKKYGMTNQPLDDHIKTILKMKKHGGSNHHEGVNYNLAKEEDGGSMYRNERYSKSAKFYRRGGSLKKFQDVGEVNPEETTVVPTEVPVTPVVANTNTEIPVVPLVEEKGEGYGGRQLYDGPYKDLNVHNFIQFANEDGSPNLTFRAEYVMEDGSIDPEVMNWRSKDRGLSVDEILKWYMWTQLSIPPEAHTVSDYSDYSYWGDKNYGKLRTVSLDDNGRVKFDINGSPMFDEFDEEKHNEYLEKALSGDPDYAWYPTRSEDAFAMARTLGLKTHFYDGEPKLTFFQSELDQMEIANQERQDEANRIAQEKWFNHHSTNPSEQFTTWSGTKYNEECWGNCDGEGWTKKSGGQSPYYVKEAYGRMNLSDMSEETLVYMQLNHPEMMEYVNPNFDNKNDALAFLEAWKGNPFGGSVTVGGKQFLLNEYSDSSWEDDPTSTGANLHGRHFDFNQADALNKIHMEWLRASTLSDTQTLHNMIMSIDGDATAHRGVLTDGTPMMMDYADGVAWLNQFDPDGRVYNWKTSKTNMGDKWIEFLPMVDGYSTEAKEDWFSNYDHSSYKSDFREVTIDNIDEAMDMMDMMGDNRFHSYESGGGGGALSTKVGTGRGSYYFNPDPNGRYISEGDPGYWENERAVIGPRGPEMTTLWGDIVATYVGGSGVNWLGRKLFNWGTKKVIGGGANALKNIWTKGRNPFKVGGKSRTFKDGAWQFTKNTAATAYQPMKFAGDSYTKSWLNRWVMNPAIPGTYGVGNLNTAANAYFVNESVQAAKKDFSEGDYLWGTANVLLGGMNIYAPYRRYKNFDHLKLKTIDWKTNPISLSTSTGNYRFTDKGRKYMHEISNLPSSRLRNYAPKIFGYKPTQTNIGKDLKISFDKYEKINRKSPMENMLLKYSPK